MSILKTMITFYTSFHKFYPQIIIICATSLLNMAIMSFHNFIPFVTRSNVPAFAKVLPKFFHIFRQDQIRGSLPSPLSLLSSVYPVRGKFSKPPYLIMCSIDFSCLFLSISIISFHIYFFT